MSVFGSPLFCAGLILHSVVGSADGGDSLENKVLKKRSVHFTWSFHFVVNSFFVGSRGTGRHHRRSADRWCLSFKSPLPLTRLQTGCRTLLSFTHTVADNTHTTRQTKGAFFFYTSVKAGSVKMKFSKQYFSLDGGDHLQRRIVGSKSSQILLPILLSDILLVTPGIKCVCVFWCRYRWRCRTFSFEYSVKVVPCFHPN